MQDYMAKLFAELGLDVDRWVANIEDLKDQPGFSPHASTNTLKVSAKRRS